MNADELRALQAPIKTRYRDDPKAAVVTLKASGEVGSDKLVCKVETGRALVEAGLHPATGGNGLEACSGDMLLEALVACAGVTLKAVATALGINLKSGLVPAGTDLQSQQSVRKGRGLLVLPALGKGAQAGNGTSLWMRIKRKPSTGAM